MTKFFALILGLALAYSIPAPAQDNSQLEIITQKTLKHYGVDSKILRSYEQSKEPPTRQDGHFFFDFPGKPGIEVLLERNYWVLALRNAKKPNGVAGYMFNPIDGQSVLNISIGNDQHERIDVLASKQPGFSGFTFGDGSVGGQKVKWQRWSDQQHLHSDCTLLLAGSTRSGASEHKVSIDVTANTQERLKALEDGMASLKLVDGKE